MFQIMLMLNYSISEKQVILLMIPNGEGWNYLAVKKVISFIKKNNV